MKLDEVIVVATSILVTACICIFSFALVSERRNTDEQIQQLQEQIDNLAGRVKAHDEIMATYEFFNEHWSAELKGEVPLRMKGNESK